MAKAIVDYISEEDYPRYQELLAMAEEAKKNAPKKERTPRAPMTAEQKKKAAESRLAKAQAALEALLAAERGETPAEA
jgi:hypothetical protein